MALNTTTNLILNVTSKSANSSLGITGLAVLQYLKVNTNQLLHGNTTITNGFITKSNTTSVSTPVIANSGTINEVTTFTLSSIVPYKENAKIATIRIIPDSSFKTVKKASIKITSNNTDAVVYLKETSTANLYNLICNIKESTIDDFECDIDYLASPIAVVTNNINRISFGSYILDRIGQNKKIKIYGSPNTPFKLTILNSDNNSILSGNSTDITPVGVKSCFSSTLSKKGYYTFTQHFPGMPTIRRTAINGSMAASGGSKIIFDSLTDVLVGDQVLIHKATGFSAKTIVGSLVVNNTDTVKVVALNPDTDNVNECTLSASITAPDNTVAIFRRATSYKVNISTTGNLKSTIPDSFPTYTLSQYLNPTLTATATITASGARINGLTAGVVDTNYIEGVVKQKSADTMILKYILTGKTFTLASGHPVESDWTTTSGDTTFSVYDFIVTGAGTATCTIFARIIVDQWGLSDTVVNLNLDNVVS
jgi:hypothetical protein